MTWEIEGPAILIAVAQFSIGTITLAFVGHLGEVELAAVFVVQDVIEGFDFGLMLWYYTVVILMVGWLKNPEIAIDAISICMSLQLWTIMINLGFIASVSVRVSNELGAGRPNAARFSVMVAVNTSIVFGIIFTIAVLGSRSYFPKIFTSKNEVIKEASKLGYFLAVTILLNSIQPVLHGVAVGAGWQASVAWINTFCYYVFGLPFGALLGYKFKLGVEGIWSGMLAGALLQAIVLSINVFGANWNKEAMYAEERLRSYETPLSLINREVAKARVTKEGRSFDMEISK